MDMVDEFHSFKDVTSETSSGLVERLGYYEMLLWIQLGEREKVEELCGDIDCNGDSLTLLQESYLLALCKKEQKEHIQRLFEIIDITKLRSSDLLVTISGYLGNFSFESVARKFLWELKESDEGVKNVSDLISIYSTCTQDLTVVNALDVVEKMGEAGVIITADILHSLLHAIDEVLEFNLFEGAYNMLGNLTNFKLEPNSSMFNCILAGYFREKNVSRALIVVKQMKEAGVKPDSITYGYLINNCNREDTITKYYDEMKQAGVQATKRIYMYLIDAYAASGQFEKAKQVLLDLDVPARYQNELKSDIISSLASLKRADALCIYEEMKKPNVKVDPKSIISLIEYSDSNGDLNTLVQLADDLQDDNSYAMFLIC